MTSGSFKTSVLIIYVFKIPHMSISSYYKIKTAPDARIRSKAVSKASENVRVFNGTQVSLPFAYHDPRKQTE